MKLRYKIGLVLTVLGAMFLWGRCSKTRAATVPKASAVLPQKDKEIITVNPLKHTVTILNASGSKTVTLPDRSSSIEVTKNGTVITSFRQMGFEHRPFVYTGYSDALRFGAGLDGVYFKRLDAGLGIAGAARYNTVVFAQVSYNIWSNVRIGITYDHKQHIGAGISVRI